MNNKINIAELQAALQQERIRNTQLEQKAQQAKEELENLLEFFTVDESEMNRAIVEMKNQIKEIKALAEAGMKRFDYSYPDCTELQQIIKITERKTNKNASVQS